MDWERSKSPCDFYIGKAKGSEGSEINSSERIVKRTKRGRAGVEDMSLSGYEYKEKKKKKYNSKDQRPEAEGKDRV